MNWMRLLGVIAFLSGSSSLYGAPLRALQLVTRALMIGGAAAALTYLTATQITSRIDQAEIKASIQAMLCGDMGPVNEELEKLTVTMGLLGNDDSPGVAVHVRVTPTPDPTAAPAANTAVDGAAPDAHPSSVEAAGETSAPADDPCKRSTATDTAATAVDGVGDATAGAVADPVADVAVAPAEESSTPPSVASASAPSGPAPAASTADAAPTTRASSADPCEVPAGITRTSVCLFLVEPIFEEASWLPPRIAGSSFLAPFIRLRFPATAYTLADVALDQIGDAKEVDLSLSRTKRVRELLERTLVEPLFLPSSPSVLWPRRLSGDIQLLSYFLGFVGLSVLSLNAASSLLVNAVIRAKRTIELPDGTWRSSALERRENIAEAADASTERSGLDDESDLEGRDRGDRVEVQASGVESFRTPWHGGLDGTDDRMNLSDAQKTALFYESVSNEVKARSRFLGVDIDPPVLLFRRAAARAVANTMDTSIVPSFLDAQASSLQSYFDARLSGIRYLLWLVPTVGFIGTILGVSDALSSTVGLQSAREVITAGAQSRVSASMGMAFDTTLVALVIAVVLMWLYHLLQGAEEAMAVFERGRSEEEVMHNARAVLRPGEPETVLQMLESMGLSAQVLVRDLDLFNSLAPRMQEAVTRFAETARRMEVDRRTGVWHRSRSRWRKILPWLAVLVLGAAVLYALAPDQLCALLRWLSSTYDS